ncbi:mechanosensitive ion channel [Rhizobium sp. P32RR-XVIII]|uniref:mechanosensitive ion channel family protein n=1 Tax=Rhizobium sp. P32RR-XVIII TaxID=2726738 RepID=UPI00145734BB|nr:mechanosensitive ion channel domain-containing protein [Rhizobium sp. P32RR-XVIII]NLS03003.1 mechanosensitive ion channel [Rhizobium sp. P32RR-XVIII]
MEQATDAIVATRTALSQASALAVQYSFAILGAIILLVGGWILAGLLSRWAFEGISRVRGIDQTLARFFANVLRYALLILVFVTVLGQFGVQTASIIAALGAAGLAIGLALQGTLQNIAAGIMLLILRPFVVGECIETSTVSGTVLEIGLFATELKTSDGLYRMAPNSTLWNTPITNYSREPTRRDELKVALAYDEDIDVAMERLVGFAKADQRVLETPSPAVFIDGIDGTTISLALRYWTKTGDWWSVSRDMVKRLKLAIDQTGHLNPLSGDAEQAGLPPTDADMTAQEGATAKRITRR